MSQKARRSIAFYAPLILYSLFIIILLITRFTIISSILGLEGMASRYIPRTYSLVPFKTISGVLGRSGHFSGWLEVIGNVLLTVPLGIYIYVFCHKRHKLLLVFISLMAVCFIEGAQFCLATGSFDIDDVILNFIGTILGLSIYHIILAICTRRDLKPRLALSCVSMSLIPILVVTVIQDVLWVPVFPALLVYTASFVVADFLIYQLFKQENERTRVLYIASCVAMSLLFFVFVNPLITP